MASFSEVSTGTQFGKKRMPMTPSSVNNKSSMMQQLDLTWEPHGVDLDLTSIKVAIPGVKQEHRGWVYAAASCPEP